MIDSSKAQWRVRIRKGGKGNDIKTYFSESYEKHPAGAEHDVLIVVKDDKISKFPFSKNAEWMAVGNYGYDIGPFLRICRERQSAYDSVVLLGAYSRILIDNWLKKIGDALDTFQVVSATGSFERGISSHPRNPCLRTSTFGISPALLTRLWPSTKQSQSSIMLNKHECYEFEHGDNSIYRRIVQAGFKGGVVGNNGMYAEHEWNQSSTFRKEEQKNLIIADNRTDDWMNSDLSKRNYLTQLAGFTLE